MSMLVFHMKPIFSVTIALALSLASISAIAHDYSKHGVKIEHPWARPTLSAHAPAAVYFDIKNNNAADDRLISAVSPRAKVVELHKTEITSEGVAKMRMLKDGIIAQAAKTTSMETGAYHVMLIDLTTPFVDGEEFPMTLTFEKAGEIEVIVKVEDRETKTSGPSRHYHAH